MENDQADGTEQPNPSRETKFSGANDGEKMFIFPVQLFTSRIGNLTGLIHTLLYVMAMHTLTAMQVHRNRGKNTQ